MEKINILKTLRTTERGEKVVTKNMIKRKKIKIYQEKRQVQN